MQTSLPQSKRLSDHTSVPFEVFVAAFTILPFLVLAYFYQALPERVPLFLNLTGEVAVWGEKSWLSVFRVPLMAAVTQVLCLLIKYGVVQSETDSPAEGVDGYTRLQKKYVVLSVGLWDWFRCLVAFKMSAASLDTVFLSLERLKFLSRPAFAVTVTAALFSVAGALFYGYRQLVVKREMRGRHGDAKIRRAVDARHVYGGVLYFDPSDPALFAGRYVLNLGSKWAWVFVACIVAYPVLVLWPV